MLGETKKPFSPSRAALGAGGRARSKSLQACLRNERECLSLKAYPLFLLLAVGILVASEELTLSQGKPDFYSSLMAGKVSDVAQLIKEHPTWANTNPFTGQPPVAEVALWGGSREMLELLLTNRADINARGTWGKSALHFAANRGDAGIVEFLLKNKADANARDDDGLTPIIQAIRSVEVIKLLLAYGADINAHGGRNTLYSQAIGNPEQAGAGVIQLILTNGADVAISGEEGISQAVLFHNDTNLLKMLVPYYANSTNPAAMPLLHGALELAIDNERQAMASAIVAACIQLQSNQLHKAVALGDTATIRSILVTNPTAVNGRGFFGWTPLHLAAITGQGQIAATLISNGAGVNAQDDISNTPLLWAAYFGYPEVVALLLDQKASMDIQGNTEFNSGNFGGNDTPLDLAIQQGYTSIATMLITNGASLGPHKYYADTPLHLAVSKGNAELVALLLSHGANVNARSQASWSFPLTSLDIAVKGSSPETVQLLLTNGARLETQQRTRDSHTNATLFHLWVAGGNTNIANLLLAAGCDPNAVNGDGQTPLHLAAGSQAAARWLLNHKVDVNAKDKNGQTPLHLIVTTGNTNTIGQLLDYKADVDATNNHGQTPLALLEAQKVNYALRRRGIAIDYESVENLLRAHGATGPLLTPKPPSGPLIW
jgi:ankyrin repeat protein